MSLNNRNRLVNRFNGGIRAARRHDRRIIIGEAAVARRRQTVVGPSVFTIHTGTVSPYYLDGLTGSVVTLEPVVEHRLGPDPTPMASVIRSRRDALRLSDEQTVKFLSFYEKEPILWNPFLEHYRNRDARAEAAGRIAAAMDVSGFGPEQVIIKFKNLRSSYCQELKKIAASESSGVARDQVYVPQVKWFSQMDSFIKPHVTSRSSLTKYIIPAVEFDDSEIENSASCDEYKWDGHSLTDGCVQSVQPDLTAIKKEPAPSPAPAPASRSTAYRKKLKLADSVSSDRASPAGSQRDITGNHRDDDAEETLDRFGKYLTSLLRTLPTHKSFALQQQIINLAIAANIDNTDS